MADDKVSIGSVDILSLSDGIGERQATELFPDVPAADLGRYSDIVSSEGTLRYKYGSFVLYSQGETILVDTGIGPNLPGSLLDELNARGIERDEITVVVNTHLHPDHVGWNVTWEEEQPRQTFPRARYWLPKADWQHFSQPERLEQYAHIGRAVMPLEQLGALELVEGERAITPEVSLVPTPGHTPGHMSLAIVSQGQRGVILGDVTHFPFQAQETAWEILFDVDKVQARRTREAMLERLERDGSLVGAGHFADTFGRFVRSGGRRYWQAR